MPKVEEVVVLKWTVRSSRPTLLSVRVAVGGVDESRVSSYLFICSSIPSSRLVNSYLPMLLYLLENSGKKG